MGWRGLGCRRVMTGWTMRRRAGLFAALTLLVSVAVLAPAPIRQIGPKLVENPSVGSPAAYQWWSGLTTVTLQWGCTTDTSQGTYIPSGYSCPPGITHWHHGIDFADGPGQHAVNCQPPTYGLSPGPGYSLFANRSGIVTYIDIPAPQQYDHTSDLQIKIDNGPYVQLLHVQTVLSGLILGTVQVVAQASGCTSPLYRFSILPPDGQSYQLAQDYSASTTFTWYTNGLSTGSYRFSIWARDASSTGVYGNSDGRWDAYNNDTVYVLY